MTLIQLKIVNSEKIFVVLYIAVYVSRVVGLVYVKRSMNVSLYFRVRQSLRVLVDSCVRVRRPP